jgi:hypothetical protein
LAIDAMVISFAALRGGGIVYTSDIGDLTKLQTLFASVRLLSVERVPKSAQSDLILQRVSHAQP